MNDPSLIPPTDEEVPVTQTTPPTPLSQIESLIHRHPVAAALSTLGFGCAIGIIACQLMPPASTPKHRALQLLEDIQSRLSEFAETTYGRGSRLANDGVTAVKPTLLPAMR